MKKRSDLWIIFLFGFLILVALILASQKPLIHQPMPTSNKTGTPSNLPVLAETMPQFQGITKWWNTADGQPLTPEKLKGKVVLIDFWTYSCINCIRTQPVLKQWWDTYQKDGLVIVGVHTPEFAFEKDPKNVGDAIVKAGLKFPIALDPDYATWNAYNNRYWPGEYFFDRQGRLRYTHFGEGKYEESEMVIRELLAEGGEVKEAPTGADTTPAFGMIKTPETYFGYERMASFENADELQRDTDQEYTIRTPKDDAWSIGGKWNIGAEMAKALTNQTIFRMNVDANAMHIVLGSTDGDRRLQVLIDGKNPTDDQLTVDTKRQNDGTVLITVNEKDLYRIARFPQGGRHTVELRVLDSGLEFYAATFGE